VERSASDSKLVESGFIMGGGKLFSYP